MVSATTSARRGSDIVQGAKQAGTDVMKVMNAPLSQVQHEYRYLHDVEVTHGMLAATLEGIGIAAGAVVGTVATGSLKGGELGAEAEGGIEGQVFYKDSWDRTGSASYTDPRTPPAGQSRSRPRFFPRLAMALILEDRGPFPTV